MFGNSMSDGYGYPPDSRSCWVDGLVRRLQVNSATSQVAVLRDLQSSNYLAAAFDSGDWLHPSNAGYAQMGRVVDFSIFAPEPMRIKQPVAAVTAP